MYVLGGDQTVAMQVVAGTPVEAAMAAAYARGAVFGGNSAGDAVQSRNMINGYTEGQRLHRVPAQGGGGRLDRRRRRRPDARPHLRHAGRHRGPARVRVRPHGPLAQRLARARPAGPGHGRRHRWRAHRQHEARRTSPATPRPTSSTRRPGAPPRRGADRTRRSPRVGSPSTWSRPATYGFDFGDHAPRSSVAQRSPSRASPAAPTRRFTTPAGAGRLLLAGGIVDDPAGDVGQRFVTLGRGTPTPGSWS